MKKIFAALLAVLFITGAVLGCGKTPQTELNQAKQQAAEQVAKTAKSGLAQLQGQAGAVQSRRRARLYR